MSGGGPRGCGMPAGLQTEHRKRAHALAALFVALATAPVGAQESVKVGLITPLTGQFTLVGHSPPIPMSRVPGNSPIISV